MKSVPSTEERVWAVLSHLSALAFGMGILLPVISWSEQRRKSNYAAFQSLQALGYQSLGYTFWILGSLVIVFIHSLFTVRELVAASQSGEDPARFLGSVMSLHFVVMIVLIGVYFLPPVIAAVATGMGRDFRFPLMGDRLARYLGYDGTITHDELSWLIEDHEDRWVAAMGHFSVIIAIWGMAAPLMAWVLQAKRSLFLKFQSMQTLAYQAGVTMLYLGTVFLYLFGIVIISLIAMMGWTGNVRMDSPVGIAGIVFFGVSLLVAVIVMLFVPLLHILGQWAGYRVLKGDDYRYPLVGRLVEKWISKNSPTKEKIP